MNSCFPTSLRFSVLAIIFCIGCSTETETDTNTKQKTNNTKNTNTQESSSDKSTKASIPDDFPEDIFVADGATKTNYAESGGAQNLILEYPESEIDAFIKSYQEGMIKQGWTEVTSSKVPIGTITNFSNGDRKCTISISPPKEKIIKVAIVLRKNSSN